MKEKRDGVLQKIHKFYYHMNTNYLFNWPASPWDVRH